MCNFFFFKQKTAYEMRITDWSSDVCSSDLDPRLYDADQRAEALGVYGAADHAHAFIAALAPTSPAASVGIGVGTPVTGIGEAPVPDGVGDHPFARLTAIEKIGRASCRERVCHTCRSRWSPSH